MAPVTDQKQPNENGNSSLVEFCSLTCFNRYAMKQEIKKNIFGIYEVMYDCPKCSLRLTSQLLEAGDVDQCPNCGTKFCIPGKQQRAAYESKLAADQAAKEAEKKLREEERRIAAEEKRLQQEERRLQQEEQSRNREIITRQDGDAKGRKELTNLLPKPSSYTPTLQTPFPFTAQVRLSIDQPQKTATGGFFHAFGITSGVMAAIAVVVLGIPILACGGCLGLTLIFTPPSVVALKAGTRNGNTDKNMSKNKDRGTRDRDTGNQDTPTVGAVIAADDFSSYNPGINSLLGQAAGGTGFTGKWQSLGLKANLNVFANPSSVGSLGTSENRDASNAGNALNFASPISIGGRQLFIRYKYVNLNTAKGHQSSRLDLNHARIGAGNRVALGSYVTDNLQLVLEPNLHTGVGNLIVDSGIGTASGTGSHVVLGLLDEQFKQIAIWVDPDTNDFYDPHTGSNSANAVTPWRIPAGGLTNFVSYSLIRNNDDWVSFDDVVFSRVMGATIAQPGSIAAQPVQVPANAPVQTPVQTGPKMTMATFHQLRAGMTYAEVKAIVGPAKEELSMLELGGIQTVILAWDAGFLSSANITFQNGKLVAKAQFGLR